LIISSQQLETYAFQTYLDLSYFFESQAKYKRFKFVPLIGPIRVELPRERASVVEDE
jgi:hypothetical protein